MLLVLVITTRSKNAGAGRRFGKREVPAPIQLQLHGFGALEGEKGSINLVLKGFFGMLFLRGEDRDGHSVGSAAAPAGAREGLGVLL